MITEFLNCKWYSAKDHESGKTSFCICGLFAKSITCALHWNSLKMFMTFTKIAYLLIWALFSRRSQLSRIWIREYCCAIMLQFNRFFIIIFQNRRFKYRYMQGDIFYTKRSGSAQRFEVKGQCLWTQFVNKHLETISSMPTCLKGLFWWWLRLSGVNFFMFKSHWSFESQQLFV